MDQNWDFECDSREFFSFTSPFSEKLFVFKDFLTFPLSQWKNCCSGNTLNIIIQVLCRYYRVCHRFRLTKQDDFFGSILTTFKLRASFKEEAGEVL